MRVGFYSLNLIDLATLVVVGLWLLKKIAEMDRFHGLRVFILTLLLSCLVFYCFVVCNCFTLGNRINYCCSENGYCVTE